MQLQQKRLNQQKAQAQKTRPMSSAKAAQLAAAQAARQTAEPIPAEGPPIQPRLNVQPEAKAAAPAVSPAGPSRTDWRRAVVLSEILAAPVSKRRR